MLHTTARLSLLDLFVLPLASVHADDTASGYADIPVSKTIIPYIGGGIGAVRTDAQLTWINNTTGVSGQLETKDWGPYWHVDAGVNFRVAPQVTVELGGRYLHTTDMKNDEKEGATASVSEFRALSGTLGVRYVF